MFRHIYNTIKKLVTRERKPAPPAPHAAAYSRGPKLPRHTRYHSDQLALDAAQERALNERGRGYDECPCPAPRGYFWKRDLTGSRRWRLYSHPVKGY